MMTEVQFMDIYLYILNRGKAPLVNIDTSQGEVIVPREFIEEDGSLLINLSPRAIRNLHIENDVVYCMATFRKEPFCLSFPLKNIIEVLEDEN